MSDIRGEVPQTAASQKSSFKLWHVIVIGIAIVAAIVASMNGISHLPSFP